MRILFVSPRQCWPAVSGAKLRDYHFARGLGTRAELTYVFFSEPGAVALSRADLPFCSNVISVPRPRMYTPTKILRGVMGKMALPLVNYSSAAMTSALRETINTQPFDLVHFDAIHMMPYENVLGVLPVVYNWHNIESELMRRYMESAPSFGRRAIASLTIKKIEAAERQILPSALGHIVCSAREQQALKQIAPGARVEVVQNGVDLQSFESQLKDSQKFRLIFVGSMAYHANSDAAIWFARDVWPAVRNRHPDWRLTLVGSSPGPEVLTLGEQPGIEVTGTVPDVKPYYEQALAAVVPLRTGGGTRLKILEAMAARVPVVSTDVGAEGLPVMSGRDVLLVKSESEWLEALEIVTGNAERRAGLIAAARHTVSSFDWDLLGRSLYGIYEGWLKS